MIVIVAGLGNLPAVAVSGMGLGLFEEFADYILGTEFRIGAVFMPVSYTHLTLPTKA